MTHSEIAKTFAFNNPNPVEEKTPIIIQRKTKTFTENGIKTVGFSYHFSHNGKVINSKYSICRVYGENPLFEVVGKNNPRLSKSLNTYTPNGKKGYYACYTNYVPEYEMLEISTIYMSGNVGVEGEPKTWEFLTNQGNDYDHPISRCSGRIFMFKDDKFFYNSHGKILWKDKEGKYYNKNFKCYTNELNKSIIPIIASSEFKTFADVEKFRISSYIDSIEYPWTWNEWYTKTAKRPISKKQEIINGLENYGLIDIKEIEKLYPLKYQLDRSATHFGKATCYKFENRDCCHFEIINDEWCVIRCFDRFISYSSDKKNETPNSYFREGARIYINNKGEVSITTPINNEYKITSNSIGNISGYNKKYIFGNFEEIVNWKQLKWIKPILENERKENILSLIVAILRHPILELVYKAGYPGIFNLLFQNNEVAKNLENYFDMPENTKGSIFKKLGCNKQILEWFDKVINEPRESYSRSHEKIIYVAKRIFKTKDLSSWSTETIETYLPSIKRMLAVTNSWDLILRTDAIYYRCSSDYNLTEEQTQQYQKVLRLESKYPNMIIRNYYDTLSMYRKLNANRKPDISDIWNISNSNELIRYHDAILAIYNQQEEERRAYYSAQEKERLEKDKKAFEKLQKERIETYEYENDIDPFVILVPHELVEITNEGQKLRHCVGGYVHRHACGETTILFLRRKEDKNTPFYTIEIRNNNVIQIHGFCNRWLGNNPEAIPFMVKYLNKIGVNYETNLLLEISTGYSGHGVLLNAADYGL